MGIAPKVASRVLILSLVAVVNLCVFIFVSVLGPFFPEYAKVHLKANNTNTGLIFAMYPLAQIFVCPFCSDLCTRFGRFSVWYTGLLMLSISTAVFGVSPSVYVSMAARAIQGGGGAMCNVAGYALVMEYSDNLPRDIGLQEVVTGLGYMAGPVVGGFIYSLMGFTPMFLFLSAIPFFLLITVSSVLRVLKSCSSEEEEQQLTIPPHSPSRQWGLLVFDRTVFLVSLSLIINSAALGFLDPTMAKHLRLVLGSGIREAGLIFGIPPLIYSTFAMVAGSISVCIGNKATIGMGLFLVAVSFLMIGPTPPLLSLLHFNLMAIWVVVLAALIGIGVGSALIIVPAVPMMLAAKEHEGGEDFKNSVASIFTGAWSVGDFLGPFLGGLLVQYVPTSVEVLCDQPDPSKCLSSFPWASSIYGASVLLVFVIFLFVVPPSPPPSDYSSYDSEESSRGSLNPSDVGDFSPRSETSPINPRKGNRRKEPYSYTKMDQDYPA